MVGIVSAVLHGRELGTFTRFDDIMKSLLLSRNVTINGRRTSLRLEQASWEAIDEICASEGVTSHELCSMIEGQRGGSSRTSAVRAFIVTYFRTAATNKGAALSGTASSILPEMAARG